MSKQTDHVAQTKVLSLNDCRDKTFFSLYQNHALRSISVDSCLFSSACSCTLHRCVCVCVCVWWVLSQIATCVEVELYKGVWNVFQSDSAQCNWSAAVIVVILYWQ